MVDSRLNVSCFTRSAVLIFVSVANSRDKIINCICLFLSDAATFCETLKRLSKIERTWDCVKKIKRVRKMFYCFFVFLIVQSNSCLPAQSVGNIWPVWLKSQQKKHLNLKSYIHRRCSHEEHPDWGFCILTMVSALPLSSRRAWFEWEKKKKSCFFCGGWGLEGCRPRVLFSWGVSSRCPDQQLTLTRPSTWFTVTPHFIQTRSRHDLNFFGRTSRRKLHLDYYLTFYFLKFCFVWFSTKNKQNTKKHKCQKPVGWRGVMSLGSAGTALTCLSAWFASGGIIPISHWRLQ